MASDRNQLVTFITGGSRGIGNAIARRLAPTCSHLFITGKTDANVIEAAGELSEVCAGEIIPLWGDLAEGRKFAESAKSAVVQKVDRIDLLVLNAGYFVEKDLASIADDDFERNISVNLNSAHYVVASLLPLLRKAAHAKVIIIGSTAAYEPYPLVPTYGIAKWGLRGYALNLRRELMADQIGVSFVSPGGTYTDMWKGEDLPPDRLLEPDDIGKLVSAIMSLSPQAVVDELIVRPMLGDIHE